MVDVMSPSVIGFLGGVFGGVVAQGLAFVRRRKRDLDRLRSVLKEIRGITEYQLNNAESDNEGLADEHLLLLRKELQEARLKVSYRLNKEQREKINTLERQFGFITHSAGDNATDLNNRQLAGRFTEKSDEALKSLRLSQNIKQKVLNR